MNKLICLVTIWLVFAGPALAQAVPRAPRWNDPRVVFITNPDEPGGGVGCTCGAIIDIAGRSHVLTVAHDTNGPRAVVNVHLQDGRRVRGTNVGYDRTADCSLFRLDTQTPFRFEVAAGAPSLPTKARMRGFPHSRAYRDRSGLLGRRYTTAWSAQGAAIEGESGGPVTDANDQIIGIIAATDGVSETVVTPWPSIRRLVDEVALKYGEAHPEKIVQETQCPGGRCYPNQSMQYMQPPGYSQQQYYPPQQPTRPNLPPSYPTTPPVVSQTPSQSCPCGPKWEAQNDVNKTTVTAIDKVTTAFDLQLKINAELREAIKVQNENVANIKNDIKTEVSTIVNQKFDTYAQEHPAVEPPKVPTIDEIVTEVEKRRKPARLRVVDAQGKYTTDFVTLKDGTDNDVIIDTRFSQPSTTAP